MTPKQRLWLTEACAEIPALFERIRNGGDEAISVLGARDINGRTVQLSIKAEVVDPGRNPLSSHASSHFPVPARSDESREKPPIHGQHRHPKWPRRW